MSLIAQVVRAPFRVRYNAPYGAPYRDPSLTRGSNDDRTCERVRSSSKHAPPPSVMHSSAVARAFGLVQWGGMEPPTSIPISNRSATRGGWKHLAPGDPTGKLRRTPRMLSILYDLFDNEWLHFGHVKALDPF